VAIGGILTDALGRVITSAIAAGRVLTDTCREICCGPTGPLYLRFAPCGFAEGGDVWVLSTLLDPNSSAILLSGGQNPTGASYCYCFRGEIRRESELPPGAFVVNTGGIIPGYDSCCPCLGAIDELGQECVFVADAVRGDCCCPLPDPTPNPWCILNGSATLTSTTPRPDGSTYTLTVAYTISNNFMTTVVTDSDGGNETSSATINVNGLPGIVPGACGYAACEAKVRAYAQALFFIGFGGGTESLSSTCTSATLSAFFSQTNEDGSTVLNEGAMTMQVVLSDAVCGCSPTGLEGEPPAEPASVMDDPMGYLPG
jgi:hypothetical protein